MLLPLLTFSLATVSPLAHAAPPHLPADHAVPFSCVPDAFVYLDQLARHRPELHAEPLALEVRHSNGIREPHTVVIVSDADGNRWLRDQHFGVFPLPGEGPAMPQVAARLLARHVENIVRARRDPLPKRAAARTPGERIAAARAVQEMIPDAKTLELDGETFTAWRRGEQYFVYHAACGTACASTSQVAPDGAVFETIARHLLASDGVAMRSPRAARSPRDVFPPRSMVDATDTRGSWLHGAP